MKKTLIATLLFLVANAANSATITVTTNTIATGDGQCDLHDAITSANTDTSVDTCTAGSGNDTILLGLNTAIPVTLPDITSNITMRRNSGIPIVQTSGSYMGRIFYIRPAGNLTLDQVSVLGGDAGGNGGCILNEGTLRIQNNSTVQNCDTSNNGGGIYNATGSSFSITDSIVRNNTSTLMGAGIFIDSGVTVPLFTRSEVSGNIANSDGGGLHTESSMTIVQSGFNGNQANGFGGGINAAASVDVDRSSITNNSTGFYSQFASDISNTTISSNNGYGLFILANSNILNVTIKNNQGFGYQGASPFPAVTMINVALDNNNNNCNTSPNGSNNISSDNSCGANATVQTTGAINLAALLTSGRTRYHGPNNGSVLIDAGNNPVCSALPVSARDQIMRPRPEIGGTACDVGAIENLNGIVFNSSIAVTKTATLTTDNGTPGEGDLNDVITFNVSVQNTGDSNLSNLIVDDPMGGGALTCNPTSLVPLQTATCTAYTYIVTQSDVNAGGTIDNTATATATDPANDVVTDNDSTSTPIVSGSSALAVTKTATLITDNGTIGAGDSGDVIRFNVSVQNTGNTTLNNLVVNDPMGGGSLSCSPITLAPAATATCTAYTYNVTQGDVDAGNPINNTATATATDPSNNPVNDSDSTSTPVAGANPLLVVVKNLTSNADEDGSGSVTLNDTLTFTITGFNNGNVTLNNVVVSDPMITPNSNTCPTVAPGANCQLVGTYVVQQSDIDNREIENTGTGDSDETPPVIDVIIEPIPQAPSINVVKTATLTTDAGTPGAGDLNDVIRFNVSVQNTGDTTLSNLFVDDPMTNTMNCSPSTLAPGQTATCTAYNYIVTQSDVDAGSPINNTAEATAETPQKNTVTDNDSTSTPVAGANPSLAIVKSLTNNADEDGSGTVTLNDTLTFTIIATNNGNVTLNNVVVSDPMITPNSNTCPTVVPGANCQLVGTYVVQQSDIDNGEIQNTGTGDSDETPPITDEVIEPVPQASTINVTKTANLTTDSGTPGAGDLNDVITFNVSVQNTGNTTLNNLVVDDPMGGGTLSCSPTTLAPAATATCTAYTYNVTQGDVDAGNPINNTATATATDPSNNPVNDSDSTSTPVAVNGSAISVNKTATLTTDNGTIGVGDANDIITFDIEVLNNGNVTLSNVVVDDPMGGGTLSCSPTTLAPAATATCTAYTYNVTQGDVDAGNPINNTATATATDPSNNPVNDSDSTSTPVAGANPSLAVVKTFTNNADEDGSGSVTLNDTLTFTIVATNNGNVTLNNVVVSDPMITPNSNTCPTVAPGANCQLVGTYVVQQSDIDNGEIQNTGTGDSDETPPVTDVVVTVINSASSISVTKTATLTTDSVTAGVGDVTDIITFNISVQNTGDSTLSNLVVDDPMGGGTLNCSPTTLTPGQTATCNEYTYMVTQNDVDASGPINNTATATATDPGNNSVTDSDTTSTPVAGANPSLTVIKELSSNADEDGSGSVTLNDTLTYTIIATNNGGITLNNVYVHDDLITPDFEMCATLNVGESCLLIGTYIVQQSDVDNGEIENTGVAGSDEIDPPISDTVVVRIGQRPQATAVPVDNPIALMIMVLAMGFFMRKKLGAQLS